ncbi:MAG TPA: ABC transporter substrate-binding protein [Candidatus Tectomicrobia bacterium]|nr:ABC transporter substrate-binding protein [Candidatus Tectomicrobia bacterium]
MGKRSCLALLVVLSLTLVFAGHIPAQEQPRYGGVLTWLEYADPGRLDIHSESPLSVLQAVAGIYSGLLQYGPDDPDRWGPDLAERWETSADGLVYTFHLRRGVKWHDGQPFTAADVKTSLDRITSPEFRSPRCGTMLAPLVERTDVVNEHAVTVRLKFPTPIFLPTLASAWCRIAPKHILARDGDLTQPKSIIGTGPFKFKRYVRGNVIEWERNPNYYNPKLPYLDGVKQFVLVERATQVAAAKSGQIMLWNVGPPMRKGEAEEVTQARGDQANVFEWPLGAIGVVYMNHQKPPFDNPEVRRAVHLAIDRQEIFARAYEGSGTPCVILDPQLFPEYALPTEEVQQGLGCRQPKEQDVAEAIRLIEQHVPGGFDLDVVVRALGPFYTDPAQLMVQQLRRIGVRGTMRTMESAAGFAAYARGDFHFIGGQGTLINSPDVHDPFAFIFHSQGSRNYSGFPDATIDALIDRGLRETDPARRGEIYRDLQRYILSQPLSQLTLGWYSGYRYVDKRVRNFKPGKLDYEGLTHTTLWLSGK